MPSDDVPVPDPDGYLYYRTGPESFWRTAAAADPGQQVQFLNSDGQWEFSILPTHADFIGEGYAVPMPAEQGRQAAADRRRAEELAARGVHPHVHQFRAITAKVEADPEYGAPVAVVEVEAAEVTVHVHVSPIDGAVVVQVDKPDESPHELRIAMSDRRLWGKAATRAGR